MYVKRSVVPASVTLPDGSVMTRADLPSRATSRWVASRKRQVVLAVRHGLIAPDEACATWDLSIEELKLWVDGYKEHGDHGLKTTAIQRVRGSARDRKSAVPPKM